MRNDTVFILLAGGKSERMGLAKGLLEYQNTFWLLEQLNRISSSTITDVYIGLGFHSQEYVNKIPWLMEAQTEFVLYKKKKIRVIINPKPELGSFSTLQSVLKQIPKNKSVLINPIDVPIINTTELQWIIETQNKVVVPNFEGKNGHPIKLDSDFCQQLLLLDPTNENSRLDLEIKKMNSSDLTKIAVTDSCVLKNLNTPKDWLAFIKN